MAEPNFDPGGFFTFDLSGGHVTTRAGRRVLVLSDTVLGPLVASAVANGDLTVVRRLGRHMGEEVRQTLGAAVDDAPTDVVVAHLTAILGLFGWGKFQLERWGDALVVRVAEAPGIDADQLALAALLGGLFSSITGRDVAAVPVSEEPEFVLVAPPIAETVWGWARSGDDLATIVARLAPGEAS